MNKEHFAFFFQIQQITDDSFTFEKLQKDGLFFSYFKIDDKYYLFIYGENYIDIDFLSQVVDLIQELDRKKRKLRSLRGFFIYALELMEAGQEVEILKTNCIPFFWRKVGNLIRQNKKGALIEFLFGTFKSEGLHSDPTKEFQGLKELEEKIKILQNQVNSLKQKLNSLEESQNLVKEVKSDPLSTDHEAPLKALLNKKQKNNTQTDSRLKTEAGFKTLVQISEDEKIDLIKIGFQLNQESKISLKKYYEGTGEYSLFQVRGYHIKYDSIRKTKLYQNLKE